MPCQSMNNCVANITGVIQFGANVALVATAPGVSTASAVADAAGAYTFQKLPPGTWTLRPSAAEAAAFEYTPASVSVPLSGNGNTAFAPTMTRVRKWVVVGNADFSAAGAGFTSLALDSSGTPFVAYYDDSVGGDATVQKFVAGTGWTVVGNAGFSAGPAIFTSLALDSTGTPYVAYQDGGNANKVTVQKFTVANGWTVVGNAGFSAGQADFTSLALDSTGTPFVAYSDFSNNNEATVQKFV